MKNTLIIGRNSVKEAIISNKNIEYILISNGHLSGSIHQIIAKAGENKIVIKKTDRKKLDTLSEGEAHQGVIAVASCIVYSEIRDILKVAENKSEIPLILILDGIEDPHNLGAIIRSAECMGVHGIIIPKRHCATVGFTVQKTSAGAIEHIKVAKVSNILNTIDDLKKLGFWIYCADAAGKPCLKQDFSSKTAVIIGAEGKGASRLSKERSDFLISIPMRGKINSLNASVAAGIIIYEIMRQRV
ncbi:MAG: 23S rRNA (guanosine(2251)-2'-O)-methyltransferase RlmB [Oscillospiraceae bacterium]|jgi:23S rRNA (guanosine2251-2'-O)-methyltransferase|nr:23S rRNA (guanosine(2251)-2'-O)-methyltransferase RlmB [Oscillospiraceae bacterium]